MGTDQFLELLYSNWLLYISSIILSFLIAIPLFKRFSASVIDPISLAIAFAAFANAVPIFLFFTKSITTSTFSYIVLAELSFWGGMYLFSGKKISFRQSSIIDNDIALTKLFFFFLLFYIGLKILLYASVGIPALMNSRLEVYEASGIKGMAILERMTSFPSFYCLVFAYYILDRKKKLKFWAYFSIIIYIVFGILSGAKGNILQPVFAYFVYSFIYLRKIVSFKKIIRYVPFLILFALVIIMLQSTEVGFSRALELLAVRFVANGDGYYIAFPKNIDYVRVNNIITYYFGNLILPLRLVKLEDVDPNIGFQLIWGLDPVYYGRFVGPNTRNPVLGWVLFKWYGILFCFLQGILTSALLYKPSRLLPHGLLTSIYVGYIYLLMISFITDAGIGMGNIFDILVNTFLLILFFILANGFIIRVKKFS